MSSAGPMSTITIAVSSFIGVIMGGIISDRWVQRNLRGRVYTSAIGLGLTVPALMFLGFGHSLVSVVGAGLCFGIGYGMFDANNNVDRKPINNKPLSVHFFEVSQYCLWYYEHDGRVCRSCCYTGVGQVDGWW